MTNYQEISVLLVEDEKDLRQLFIWEFEDHDMSVDVAGTVDEAKDKLKNNSYQIVLSDLKMPGESGVELMKFLKENNRGPQLRYLMTAFSDENLDLEELEVKQVFKKPVKTTDVLNQIKKDLEKLGE